MSTASFKPNKIRFQLLLLKRIEFKVAVCFFYKVTKKTAEPNIKASSGSETV